VRLEERYRTHEGYVRDVRESANRLVRERLLLAEDAARIIADAERSDVLSKPSKARQTP
jgi:hypothetical protein